MKKCLNCNVTILDETHVCPLCRQVLQKDDKTPDFIGSVYPDLSGKFQVARLIENIVLFLSICVEATLLTIVILRGSDIHIAMFAGLALIYINGILRMTITGKSGYMFRFIFGILFSLIILAGVDVLTNYKGWSMEFVFPAGILLLNLGIAALMILNRRNWQSYMVAQLSAVLLSLIPFVLLLVGVISYPYVVLLALGVSVFFFLGTLIIGDYRARTELRRRFHI